MAESIRTFLGPELALPTSHAFLLEGCKSTYGVMVMILL